MNEETTIRKWKTLVQRYLWVLPSGLTILLVAAFCFSYTQRVDNYTWLANMISSLQNSSWQNTALSHQDYVALVRDRGLLSYGVVAVLYLGACLVALAIGVYIAKESSPRKRWFLRVLMLLALAVAIGITFHFFQNPPRSERCDQSDVWSQLVCKTIGNNWIIGNRNIGAAVISSHLWLDALGITIATFFALVTSTILRSESKPKNDAKHVKEQIRYLRMMLYVGSFLLIIATLRLRIILSWTLEYLQPYPLAADEKQISFLVNSLNGFIANVVTSMGTFYSLLLAVIFVPAILILIKRAPKSGDVISPLSEQLLRLPAIMGPLLAGPIWEFVNRFK